MSDPERMCLPALGPHKVGSTQLAMERQKLPGPYYLLLIFGDLMDSGGRAGPELPVEESLGSTQGSDGLLYPQGHTGSPT